MDMNSVARKLKNNRYPTVETFFNDLFLVYDNAIRYFEQGGLFKSMDIYEAAKVCDRSFRTIVRVFGVVSVFLCCCSSLFEHT